MPTRRSLDLVGLQSPILRLASFTPKKVSQKRRNTLKWRNKSAGKDSQFFDRSAVGRSVPRHHRTARATLATRALKLKQRRHVNIRLTIVSMHG
jgi:hypothetical protein